MLEWINSMKLKLPRGYLSWSQLNLWETSPKKYKERYFFGEESFVSKEMRFGKKLANAIEAGKTDDPMIEQAIAIIPKYDKVEYKIECVLKYGKVEIPLLGFIDNYKNGSLREIKTGKVSWTQKRANGHGQLDFYALMEHIQTGKIPKIHLDWLETENLGNGIVLTGHIQSFEVKKTTLDMLKMTSRIVKAAQEISKAYQLELKSII